MKVSAVTKADVLEYMRSDDADSIAINIYMDAAKKFIADYTGLTMEELDDYDDLTTAFLVIVADMYDNRNYVSDKNQTRNQFVKQVLDLHCQNFLPTGDDEP